jgi:hypothetical protein
LRYFPKLKQRVLESEYSLFYYCAESLAAQDRLLSLRNLDWLLRLRLRVLWLSILLLRLISPHIIAIVLAFLHQVVPLALRLPNLPPEPDNTDADCNDELPHL